jgi:hypothetical protein
MAVRSDITAAHEWFAGEDKELHFTVLDADGNPVDASWLGARMGAPAAGARRGSRTHLEDVEQRDLAQRGL